LLTDEEVNRVVNVDEGAIQGVLYRVKKFLEEQAEKTKQKQQETKVQKDTVKDKLRKMREGILTKGDPEGDDERSLLVRDLKDTLALLEHKVKRLTIQLKSKDEKIKIYTRKLDKAAEEAQLNAQQTHNDTQNHEEEVYEDDEY
jgi:hypothetical protein